MLRMGSDFPAQDYSVCKNVSGEPASTSYQRADLNLRQVRRHDRAHEVQGGTLFNLIGTHQVPVSERRLKATRDHVET